MTVITHRPRGVEHPYARSLDQLSPAIPRVGARLQIGITTTEPVDSVECVLEVHGTRQVLPMAPVNGADSDAAQLAGGEGHLAAAQEAALAADNGWTVTLPAVPEHDGQYWFRGHRRDGSTTHDTEPFPLTPAHWTQQPHGTITGADAKLIPGSIAWLVSSAGVHRARFSLALQPDEHVVGFGERYDHLDQRGHTLDAVVFEQYKSQAEHHRTYLPMPFAHVISETGSSWGFHVNTSRRTWYDIAHSQPDRLTIEVDLGLPGITTPTAQDHNVTITVWQGTPTDVLTGFLNQVGHPEELPEWIFDLWASGNEWNTQALVEAQIERHQAEHVPVGVLVIEAWSDEEGFTIFRDAQYIPNHGEPHHSSDFSYPADGAWPDPAAMITKLHQQGVKVILWQIPLQKTEDDLGPQAVAQREALLASGHVVREADGTPYRNRGWWFADALMPDFTTKAGRDWWTAQRRYLVDELDVDGFKTDGGEHAWGADLRYEDGTRGDQSNNLYPVHYARAYGDLLRSAGKAPVTFSRSGFTGSQAHGIYWAGDENSTWEAFRASITAGLTASASGILYWGWDLAGFSGPIPEADLYARALAAATFMPITQYHSEFNHHQQPLRDRTPWNVADQTGHPELIDLARHYGYVRRDLKDYLVAQARDCIRHSQPLMRALAFDHSDDPQIWQHPLQYKLGDQLLINPITEPNTGEWSTYLPAGQWTDYWTGDIHTGQTTVTRYYPWAEIPVFRLING